MIEEWSLNLFPGVFSSCDIYSLHMMYTGANQVNSWNFLPLFFPSVLQPPQPTPKNSGEDEGHNTKEKNNDSVLQRWATLIQIKVCHFLEHAFNRPAPEAPRLTPTLFSTAGGGRLTPTSLSFPPLGPSV